MTKEECLLILQSQVTTLRDRSAELLKDPMLMKDWVAKTKYLQDSMAKLNPCDALWLEKEYKIFFEKEINPRVQNHH